MSAFYDQASLVMVPSGYKNGKLYSQKPLSTSGELSFSRASNATRVNSSGLVEKVRENLALYSEQFDNVAWLKGTLSVTANAGTAPDGTASADLMYPSASSTNSVIYNGITISSGVEYTNSIYVKASGKTWVFVRGINNANGVWFDVVNGVKGTTGSGVSGDITSVGSGWYRCSVTQTSSSTTGRLVVLVVDGDGSTAVTANGTDGLLVWGAQQEAGVMTDYIGPTTSAAVSVGPVSGLPRLDYSGGTSCPALKLEPQRSNLLTFSEQFDNGAWGKTNLNITANNTASPDGYTNADKIVADTTNGVHRIEQNKATATQVATQSVFAKASGYNFIALENGGEVAYFNISTGVVGTVSAGTASIQNYGNGWYRCIFTATAVNTKSFIYLASADNVVTFAGDNTSAVFIYGAQFEAGAYATSYIPTLSSAVTRVVDYCSKTSSTIAADAKTWFCDANITEGTIEGASEMYLTIRGGAYEGYFRYFPSNSLQLQYYGLSGYVQIILNSAIPAGTTTRVKMAARIEDNDFAFYVNGVQIGTNTTATRGTGMNILEIGTYGIGAGYHVSDSINQVLLFPTALTNAQLAELTA